MDFYYLDQDNQPRGPVTALELRNLAHSGVVNQSTLVAPVGSQDWIPITEVLQTGIALNPVNARPITDTYAITGFILSLVGMMCCGLLSIAGVVLGHMSLKRIQEDPYLGGKGFAIAALVLGYLSITFNVLYWGFVIVVAIMEGTIGSGFSP